MNIEGLIQALPDYYTPKDHDLILRAFRFAKKAHKGQKRSSGEDYVYHCVAVAFILADLRVPPLVVAAGLLHDTVEDTRVELEDIEKEFGAEVASLVDGVTKLTHLPRVSRSDQNIEIVQQETELENEKK